MASSAISARPWILACRGGSRSGSARALDAYEHRKNLYGVLAHIAAVMHFVDRLRECLALEEGPQAFCAVVDRELALEDIGEQGHGMRMPARFLAWLQRDLRGRDLRGRAGGIADQLLGYGRAGRQNHSHTRRDMRRRGRLDGVCCKDVQ